MKHFVFILLLSSLPAWAIDLHLPETVVALQCSGDTSPITLQRHDWELAGMHYHMIPGDINVPLYAQYDRIRRLSPELAKMVLNALENIPDRYHSSYDTISIDWRTQASFETGPVAFPASLYGCSVEPILVNQPHVVNAVDDFGFTESVNYSFYGSTDLFHSLDTVDQAITLLIAEGLPDDLARIALSDEIASMSLLDFAAATAEYNVTLGWNGQRVSDCEWFKNGSPSSCLAKETTCAKEASHPTYFPNGYLANADTQSGSICLKDQSAANTSDKISCLTSITYNESGKVELCDGKAVP